MLRLNRRCTLVLAGAASVCLGLMGTSTVARGSAADELTLTPTVTKPLYLQDTAPAAEPPAKPLAGALDKAGIKTGPFAVYGFAEGSYTYSFSNPPGNFITGRVFDIDNQEVMLNQLDLIVEKTVDAAAAAKDKKFDIGGRMEWVYGNDARFIHSNGLNFYGAATPQLSPDNQLDLVQAYVDFAVPVGNGLTIRAGKFVTLLGYETINPTTNPLYSHSYMFGYAIPFTHTGVLGMYNLTDKMTLTAGITRGWDQALEDNNEDPDYTGQIKYVFNEKLTGYLNVITGPEQTDNNSNYRTVFDGIIVWSIDDHWSVVGNADYGWEADAAADGSDATWYGVAGYVGYKVNNMFTLNARLEYFNDDDGARGLGTTVYEATAGVSIKPMPNSEIGQNLVIRPELRYDYGDDPIFDGGTDDYQWTAAVDAIFTF